MRDFFKKIKKIQYRILYLFYSLLLFACSSQSTDESVSAQYSERVDKVEQAINLKTGNSVQFLPNSVTHREVKAESSLPLSSGPMFKQFALKNGLVIEYLARHALPNISIAVIVDAGKYQLNSKEERLSPLVLKLLRQGTNKYPKTIFQKRVSLLGKSIKYWQSAQYSIVAVDIFPQDLEFALDLLSQQLAHLNPNDDALRKVIEQQLLENKLTQSSGAYLTKLLFYQNNYPADHLYYHLQPDSDEIKKVSMKQLIAFYQSKYRPERSRIIISGDLDEKRLKKQFNHYFSDWPSSQKKPLEQKPSINTQQAALIVVKKRNKNTHANFDFIERAGAQQVDLLYGMVTVSRLSPDWLSLKMIASLLGGGPDSRLFTDLREKKGLAYFISARQLAGRNSSPFLIQTSVAHNKLIPMIVGINNHLKHLCHNKLEAHELKQIKQQLSGEIIFKLQNNQQIINNKIQQFDNGLANNYLLEQKKLINNITAEQLFTVVNKYLCGKHNIIAAGQLNKLDSNFHKKLTGYIFKQHHLPLR